MRFARFVLLLGCMQTLLLSAKGSFWSRISVTHYFKPHSVASRRGKKPFGRPKALVHHRRVGAQSAMLTTDLGSFHVKAHLRQNQQPTFDKLQSVMVEGVVGA